MTVYDLADIERQRRDPGKLYQEFLRVPALSAGLYVLEAGATDPQLPHTEDEIYYVVSGRGQFTVDDANYQVATGSVIYVPANADHRFHAIEETLSLLVIFAPEEYANAPKPD